MTRFIAAALALVAVTSACQRIAPSSPDPNTVPRIALTLDASKAATVDVIGLPDQDLSQLASRTWTRDEWAALFRITVAGGVASEERPAVLGAYALSDARLRFTPQFPLDPGQRYDAVLDPSRLPKVAGDAPAPWRFRLVRASIEIPAPERRPTTTVADVFPSGSEVPENQLRLYISFSAPMALGGGLEHVHLLDDKGKTVQDPFLPLDVELWNEDRTRFTILFDPGRVKRGILPNEQMGRSLVAGRTYELVVDGAWRDAQGQPLIASFQRPFRVGPAEELAIEPARWRLEPPVAGTRDPFVVSFDRPLDYGLLQRALAVSTARGERVPGTIGVGQGETRWRFIPTAPWPAGDYRLLAASILEDVAGNRIGRPFEVEAFENGTLAAGARSAVLNFRVVAGGR